MNTLRLTPLIRAWVITLVALFLAEQVAQRALGVSLTPVLGLVPEAVVLRGYFWQVLTYAFLHADLTHLLLNSLMLVFLGSELEVLWGRKKLALYAVICALGGAVAYLLLQVFVWGAQGLSTPMVGASGAIYGLLAAYGLLFSERTLMFMMLFPMKAKHFIWVLVAVEFFTSVSSGRGGLAAAAHLAGMGAGFVTLLVWARQSARRKNPRAPRGGRTGKRPVHLRLVVSDKTPPESKPRDSGGSGGEGPTFH